MCSSCKCSPDESILYFTVVTMLSHHVFLDLLYSRIIFSPFSKLLIVNVFKTAEVNAPFKKRLSKYMAETTPAPSDHLLRPLSPITPPLPEDSFHPLLHTPCGSLLPNGLAYSPMPSLPASRCNTPLQFEVRAQPHQHQILLLY